MDTVDETKIAKCATEAAMPIIVNGDEARRTEFPHMVSGCGCVINYSLIQQQNINLRRWLDTKFITKLNGTVVVH